MAILLVALIVGSLTFFSVNQSGFKREISRNARDIGSNVVILPAEVDQFQYHTDGGFSDVTMPESMVGQIIEYKASLNHLIPMLERKSRCSYGGVSVNARIVGLSASIPMPGRPKAPMQKSIAENEVQLGSELAHSLGIQRGETPTIKIQGVPFTVQRVNRENGTWQDAAALIDLQSAQLAFELPGRISRIEAIECTDERCAQTGLKSDVVLANELANITDQALILRREKIAIARHGIRQLNTANLHLLGNVLWVLLAAGIMVLSGLNSYQRQSEVGILQSLGYGQTRVATIFVMRSFLLTAAGSTIGIVFGAATAFILSQPLFLATGNKLSIDWLNVIMIGVVATLLAAIAGSIPALIAATRPPVDAIGRDG